jgi:hypothetical protein
MNRARTSSTLYVGAIGALLVLGFLPLALGPAMAATSPQGQAGLMVPLYAYPTDPSWAGLIQAQEAHPNVPVIAVISPTGDGPGSSKDPNFVSGIASLQAAGITVVGYINTHYTSTQLSTVKQWTADYLHWYHVNGVFFDCMSNIAGQAGYYSSAASYAKSIGLSLTVGNPGTSVPPNYVGITDILVIYENPGLPSVSTISSYSMGYPASNFGMMAYGVGQPSQSYISRVTQYVSWFYATDASGGDPYDVLPSYIGSEMSILSSIDSSTTTTTATSTSSTSGAQLKVVSQNMLGNPVTEYYTQLYSSSGGVLGTGYTPSTYTLSSGATYQLESDSYGPCTFDHWSGGGVTGSTQDPVSISISGPTTIVAVYSGPSCGSQTTSTTTTSTTSTTTTTRSTSTSSASQTSILVKSVNQYGQPITGYWTVLYDSSGNPLATGYTSKTFGSIQPGVSYQVELDGYGGCTFSYWQDTGNTSNIRDFTSGTGQQTLTGVLSCS